MVACNENYFKLIIAIEHDDVEAATRILSENFDKRFLQSIGSLQVNAFQLAAWHGRIEFLEILHKNGANVNTADKIGRSPLYHAAHRGNVEVVHWLLEHGACIETKIGIDSCTKGMPNASLGPYVIGQNLPVPECWGRTPLHQAVKNNHSEIVRLLVNARASVNEQDDRGITPLLLAGSSVTQRDLDEMSKFVNIVEILVSANACTDVIHPDTGTTALHHATALGSRLATKTLLDGGASPFYQCKSTGSTPLHIAASIGSLDTLSVLLAKMSPDHIDIRDKINRTPLHRASYQGHRECVRALIDHGGNLAAVTDTGITVVDAIFTHIPQPVLFLMEILDSRVRTNSKCVDKNPHITVNFNVLVPKGEQQMGVLTALIAAASDVEQLTILQHPLVETFLRFKWSKLRVFFFILVLIHAMLVVSLSIYTLILLQTKSDNFFLRKVLTFCSLAILIHNVAQVLLVPRYYLKQSETWLSFLCGILSLIISVASDIAEKVSLELMENKLNSPQQPSHWLLHLISIAILLGWMQMMLLVGRFPICGYYALMFSTVLKNILKVLLAFVCLIVGFALSFAVLFHGNDQFRNSWRAVVKTVVMMMGEYDYENLFRDRTEQGPSAENESSFLPATGRVVFLAFVMLASIVLMNLMIGLAVNDIQGLEKEGHICQLLKQAEFLGHLERVTSHRFFRSNWLHPWLSSFLDSRRGIPTKITFGYHERYFHDSSPDVPAPLREELFLVASRNSRDSESLITTRKQENRNTELTSLLEDALLQLRGSYYSKRIERKFSNSIFARSQIYRRKSINL